MSNGQRQAIQLPFPLKGLDETWAFDKQPEGTAADALNVRPFDAVDHRLRGGQRDGLSKYLTDAVNGANYIQSLAQVTTALDPGSIEADTLVFEDDFTAYGNGILHVLNATDWPAAYRATSTSFGQIWLQNLVTAGKGMVVTAASDAVTSTDDGTASVMTMIKPLTLGDAYLVRMYIQLGQASVVADWGKNTTDILIRGNTTTKTGYVILARPANEKMIFSVSRLTGAGADVEIVAPTDYFLTGGKDYDDELMWGVSVNGSSVVVKMQGNTVLSFTATLLAGDARIGIAGGMGSLADAFDGDINKVEIYTGVAPTSYRQTHLIAVSGGNIYAGDTDGISLASSGASAVTSNRPVAIQEAFSEVYFADGYDTGYKVMDMATKLVSAWTPTDGALPIGTTDASQACRYLDLYRGRIVAWGLSEDPHNWFMSRAGDPLDWDYAPATTDATQAVAGNNSDAGELGDVVIACAPYSDDLMLMGGDHTLWVMRGDPAAGGVIDSISYQTGICSPKAFAWDPEGVIYFVGAGQLWRMAGGNSQPESISQRRLDKTFQEIDLAVYRVELIWDRQRQGLHIFLIPNAEPAADEAPTHIYWDRRTDSFWKDEYPESMGPTAVHTFDADDPNDRALLLGGWDSYIRYVNDGQKSDDGTAIGSYVYYTPIMPWGPLVEGRLIELKATMSIDSDPVQIFVSGGPSADYVTLESPYTYSRALLPGQNPTMRQRVNGTAFQVRLFGRGKIDETWAIETLTGIFKPGGRSRRRGLI